MTQTNQANKTKHRYLITPLLIALSCVQSTYQIEFSSHSLTDQSSDPFAQTRLLMIDNDSQLTKFNKYKHNIEEHMKSHSRKSEKPQKVSNSKERLNPKHDDDKQEREKASDFETIRMVIEIITNGASSPKHDSPIKLKWPLSKNQQLTKVGLRQQFTAGQQIAMQYPFLKENLDIDTEVFSFSDYSNHTRLSSMAHLAGISSLRTISDYQFQANATELRPPFELDDEIQQQAGQKIPLALPIYLQNSSDSDFIQKLFNSYQFSVCPDLHNSIQKTIHPHLVEIEKSQYFKDKMAILKERLNEIQALKMLEADKPLGIKDCFKISEIIRADQYHSEDPLIKREDPLNQILKSCYSFSKSFIGLNLKFQKAILSNLVEHYSQAITLKDYSVRYGEYHFPVKYIQYSGTDMVMSGLLNLFDQSSPYCHMNELLHGYNSTDGKSACLQSPEFASRIVFEFYTNESNSLRVVRTKYNDKYLDFCQNQDHDNKYPCTTKAFVAISKGLILDYEQFCPTGEESDKSKLVVLVIIVAIMSTICVALIGSIFYLVGQNYNLKKILKRKKRELMLRSKHGSGDLRDWLRETNGKTTDQGKNSQASVIRNIVQIENTDRISEQVDAYGNYQRMKGDPNSRYSFQPPQYTGIKARDFKNKGKDSSDKESQNQ